MELWIPLTIAAAFFQNIRSAMQKHLKGRLSTLGAAYVRFLYAWPVALIYFFAVIVYEGHALPGFTATFLVYSLLGGICQIMFTVFLLWLFSFHNFAVGTTLSKLETVMVAIFGLLLLGDRLTPAIILAIAMSTAGLVVLSAGQAKLGIANLVAGLWRLPTLIGGSVIIEQVFQWPGVGNEFVQAVRGQDYPLVMMIALFSVLAMLLANDQLLRIRIGNQHRQNHHCDDVHLLTT